MRFISMFRNLFRRAPVAKHIVEKLDKCEEQDRASTESFVASRAKIAEVKQRRANERTGMVGNGSHS